MTELIDTLGHALAVLGVPPEVWLALQDLWADSPRLPAEAGVGLLALASFLAATVLPGGSEVLLAGFLTLHPEQAWPAWWWCSIGNTLGGLLTWWMARSLPPERLTARLDARWLARVERHGAKTLLAAWLPVVGDALCLVAGWLRLPLLACAGWMLLGKAARYALVTWLAV